MATIINNDMVLQDFIGGYRGGMFQWTPGHTSSQSQNKGLQRLYTQNVENRTACLGVFNGLSIASAN